jgi:DnaJ domain
MGPFIFGLAVLVLGLLAMQGFTRANPAAMARQIRFIAGSFVLVGAGVLLVRGMAGSAALLGILGWALLSGRGVTPWGPGGWGSAQKSAGQGSQIKTSHLEMDLDHDSGAIRGRVVKGIFKGRDIESLSPADVALLWQDCRFTDVQSAQLLEAYLDRLHPGWREDMQRGEDELASGPDGRMTVANAYEILGLQPGASEDDIRKAHRELMKRMHPDQGGSNYLASKINEAKDVLLGV